VNSVVWSPDSTRLVSGSRDRSLILWQLASDQLENVAALWKMDLPALLARGCDWLKDYGEDRLTVEDRLPEPTLSHLD
jgi:WD40 repeat protein